VARRAAKRAGTLKGRRAVWRWGWESTRVAWRRARVVLLQAHGFQHHLGGRGPRLLHARPVQRVDGSGDGVQRRAAAGDAAAAAGCAAAHPGARGRAAIAWAPSHRCVPPLPRRECARRGRSATRMASRHQRSLGACDTKVLQNDPPGGHRNRSNGRCGSQRTIDCHATAHVLSISPAAPAASDSHTHYEGVRLAPCTATPSPTRSTERTLQVSYAQRRCIDLAILGGYDPPASIRVYRQHLSAVCGSRRPHTRTDLSL
jgi:hypothetical protein